MSPTRILALSGSLRARSTNVAVLDAAALLAPLHVEITRFTELDALPFFNPDLDLAGMTPPVGIGGFRRLVGAADAVLICTPEYAHGVPGVLKNALDWLVSDPCAVGKPVASINTAARAYHAHESLLETLRTMAMTVVVEASITLPVRAGSMTVASIRGDPELVAAIRAAVDALVAAAGARCSGAGPARHRVVH